MVGIFSFQLGPYKTTAITFLFKRHINTSMPLLDIIEPIHKMTHVNFPHLLQSLPPLPLSYCRRLHAQENNSYHQMDATRCIGFRVHVPNERYNFRSFTSELSVMRSRRPHGADTDSPWDPLPTVTCNSNRLPP
ncbi:hypothetical protein TraAM80_08777 [Trypanosoma rangeli]|uniref:Uncharacterized protein n=1 Tax=Trypanosoma rangeli TaxID=5698 RepID=A0A3R7N1F4_TRYRA|nr:uncharacterized protein TraAM80_08777 [Trypanosoma rangeli]RNE98459.1 hypothetical protein TraAM80_08777 [Trypanosoma rangeli]|eukprot:RNE98459.1 hypothetical protein TraAM80_08777 [Trypanosoma rangeli]